MLNQTIIRNLLTGFCSFYKLSIRVIKLLIMSAGFRYYGFIFLLCSINVAQAQTLRVCYIPDSRSTYQDHGYTFDGQYMAGSGASKLLNADNFGSNGIVKQEVVLVALKDIPISPATISKANCGAVFVGMFYNPQSPEVIKVSELNAIREWSLQKKENLAVICESHAAAWGYERMDSESKISTATADGEKTKIFDGPFGKVSRFVQGGHAIGWLKGGAPVILSKNEQGNTSVAYDKVTGDIILGDVDILTSLGGISPGKSINNDNDILFANIWAYAMDLTKKPLPKGKVKLSFQVFDKITFKKIVASVVITDKAIASTEIDTDSSGSAAVLLTSNQVYRFQIRFAGYQDYFTEKYISDTTSGAFDFALTPKAPKVEKIEKPGQTEKTETIEKINKPLVLNHLFFEQSKFNILPASFGELDSLADRLKSEPNLKIELRGHTDKIGPADKNLILSFDRVKAVKQYLVSKGVDPIRIRTRGFGDTQRVYLGQDKELRMKNRRVEIVFVR
ncbi:OmpA family protein [Dyadobacter frigoris]|uniref:OmpA family protein n=1 Tax=Dyadobacter frigoris TaxID=2576211 RepID=UPI0025550086|nr:OmpA family protein [Dyadobacter frigoris]